MKVSVYAIYVIACLLACGAAVLTGVVLSGYGHLGAQMGMVLLCNDGGGFLPSRGFLGWSTFPPRSSPLPGLLDFGANLPTAPQNRPLGCCSCIALFWAFAGAPRQLASSKPPGFSLTLKTPRAEWVARDPDPGGVCQVRRGIPKTLWVG